MQVRTLLIAATLLASIPVLGACSSQGGGTAGYSDTALYYPPPVNYNPKAGMLPMYSEPFNSGVPSSPPFRP
jgi:hypothetical protein